MATTNLQSISLGDVLLQSGTGSPDHVSVEGSIYTDDSTGTVWTNQDSISGWTALYKTGWAEMYTSATTTVSPSTSTFTSITSNMIFRGGNGFSFSGGVLTVRPGRGGTYCLITTMSLQRNAATTFYDVGTYINATVPPQGDFHRSSVDTTRTYTNIIAKAYKTLAAGDTIGPCIKAGGAGNVNIIECNCIAWRIGD
jgi:hypothetical protein